MDQDTIHSPLAVTYAEALMQLASEEHDVPDAVEAVGLELSDLRKIILNVPMVTALLVDPAIGGEERHKLLDRVFDGRVSPLLMKFLHVLGEKGRLNLISSIAGAYGVLLDKRNGRVEVDITVVSRLEPDALENVRKRIGTALNREVVLHQYVDASIMGGLVLRVQDKLIDGSVRGQLDALREKILASRPK